MVPRVALVTGLILLVSVSAFMAPNVKSQQSTTHTSILISSATMTLTGYLSQSNSVTIATGTITAAATTFENIGSCQIGVGPLFDAEGPIHLTYAASGPMMMYVVDQGTLTAWSSTMFGGGCQPPVGNWTPYKLGSTYPLAGNLDVNLSVGSYGVVLVAPTSEANPSATVAVSPVAYTQTMAVSNSTVLITTRNSLTQALATSIEQVSSTTATLSPTNFSSEEAAVVVIVLLIVGTFIYYWPRHRSQHLRSLAQAELNYFLFLK